MAKAKAADRPPLYDPAVHTDPTEVVFVELYCLCGSMWRQRDPAPVMEPFVRSWLRQHSGDGHGPASKKQCVDERERRKHAIHVATGRAADYQRKTYERLDDSCTKPRPWPAFPESVEG